MFAYVSNFRHPVYDTNMSDDIMVAKCVSEIYVLSNKHEVLTTLQRIFYIDGPLNPFTRFVV